MGEFIRMSEETQQKLKDIKLIDRETYEDVVLRLLKEHKGK